MLLLADLEILRDLDLLLAGLTDRDLLLETLRDLDRDLDRDTDREADLEADLPFF